MSIEYQCAECRGRGFIEGIGERKVECWDCDGGGDPHILSFGGAHCWVEVADGDRMIVLMRRQRK